MNRNCEFSETIHYLNINKKMLDDLKIIVILWVERLRKCRKPRDISQMADGKGVNYDKPN